MHQQALTSNPFLFGHSLSDYRRMFDLKDQDLTRRVLECGGPSSFNAQMQKLHHRVVSINDVYALSPRELMPLLHDRSLKLFNNIELNQNSYCWQANGSLAEMKKNHTTAVTTFLDDFAKGKAAGRYLPLKLNHLPFADLEFELALCSHYLFAGDIEANINTHLQMIHELLRIANEVRIFPLLDRAGDVSSLLGPIMLSLQQESVDVEIKAVPYHFQKQGNAMLRITAQTCALT